MPLLDMMMDAGVDVLMGVDPAQDRMMDLRALKERTAGRMCLWGGVCGYLTLERGTPQDVAAQVQRSLAALAPGGGFILAPVTNVREDNARVWRNLDAMVEAWRSLRRGPFSSTGQQGPMGRGSGPAGSRLTRS
jgi:uroporphyrinogen decarboxylase